MGAVFGVAVRCPLVEAFSADVENVPLKSLGEGVFAEVSAINSPLPLSTVVNETLMSPGFKKLSTPTPVVKWLSPTMTLPHSSMP